MSAARLAVVAIACLLASAAGAAAQMTEAEFTDYFLKRAEASLPGVKINSVGRLQVHSKDAQGREVTTFLDNAYRQYAAFPDHLTSIVDNQLRAIGSVGSQLAAAASPAKDTGAILAVIKPADYLENVRQQLARSGLAGRDVPLAFRKLNDDLYELYVFDSETGMRMVTKKDLADKKIDEHDLEGLAALNLTAYFEKKGVRVTRLEKVGEARVYTVTIDQNYEASILLLDRYWNKKTFDVPGDIVMFPTARNVVLVTGSEDAEGMRIAGLVAAKGYKELGYSISPYGYTHQNGEWQRHP